MPHDPSTVHLAVEVRRAIINAAVEVLSEVGLERAKLGEIAQRAGTSVGNVYKYFGSKDEIFFAAIPPEFTGQLADRIRTQVEAHARDLPQSDRHELSRQDA